MTQNPVENVPAKDRLEDPGLLRALIQSLPDHLYLKDTEGRFVIGNVGQIGALGAASPEEVVGRTVFDFFPRKLAERYHSDEQEVLRSGRPLIDQEEPSVDDEGNRRWYSTTKVPLRNGSGKVVGLVGATRDVTERKEAEEALRENEERYRAVVEQSAEGIWVFDPDTKQVLESNTTFQEMLGYTAEELRGMTNYDFVAHDREDVDSAIRRVVRKRKGFFGERRYRRKDGTILDVEVSGNMIPCQGKEVVCGVARDLTERKRAETRLRESEERFRTAFEDAPVGVALVGLDKRYLRVNRALCEMLGYSEKALLEKTSLEITHPDDREVSAERARQAIEGEVGSYVLERRYIHADGHQVWHLSSVSLIRDSRGEPSHFVCLHQDVTGRKALEEQLRHQAFHDPLTELPNRALFLDRLEHALARQEEGSVAVLLMDLNDFKVVNDSLGHDMGNAVLVEVAKRLRDTVRPGDTVGRIFGDEFAVLLEAPANAEEARRVTEKIGERLQAPFDVDGQEVFVSPSIGIALGDSPQSEPKDVLRHADLAMYQAKSRGKAEYEVYSPSMNARAVKRMDLESDLRRAIERGEFEVHYQPMIELRTGKIGGFEALARWRHPERGLVAADEFIWIAEETGLIRPIGRWGLEEACRQAKEWRERYPDRALLMGVNFSASQFSHQADLIPKVLSDTGLDPGGLQLEITERAVMDDAEFSLGKLRRLKSLGVSLAIDDYGMGYSCLYYLKHMPVDHLKIDRSFVAGLGEDPGDAAIVSGTIGLGHALGLKVVAEGAETEEQLARLREMGCDLAQGFYFAKPLSNEAAEKLLAEEVSW